MSMKIAGVDIATLDLKAAGTWPWPLKLAAYAMAFLFGAALAGYFVWRPANTALDTAQAKEVTMKREFAAKQAQAADLDALRVQMKQMQALLHQELAQLPNKTQMPQLVIDISQAAMGNGIKVDLFRPTQKIVKDFYAIQPISIHMEGTYGQFGAFLSDVASLPRVVIMTPQRLLLSPETTPDGKPDAATGPDADDPILVLQGTVETYRALDANEVAARDKARAAAASKNAPHPAKK